MQPETLRARVNQAETDTGERPGRTTSVVRRLADLGRELHELRRANAILRNASASSRRSSTARRPSNGIHRCQPLVRGRAELPPQQVARALTTPPTPAVPRRPRFAEADLSKVVAEEHAAELPVYGARKLGWPCIASGSRSRSTVKRPCGPPTCAESFEAGKAHYDSEQGLHPCQGHGEPGIHRPCPNQRCVADFTNVRGARGWGSAISRS